MMKLIFFLLGIFLAAANAHSVGTVEEEVLDVSSAQYLRERAATVAELLSQLKTLEIEPASDDHQRAPLTCSARESFAKNGELDTRKRWYNMGDGTHVIPMVFQPGYTNQERNTVLQAMKDIEGKTCIRFWVYGSENDVRGFNYVFIKKTDAGCWAYIGNLQQGKQEMNLQQNGCIWKSVAIHELIHVIGFWHAHMVPERDDYVTIMWDNIEQGQGHNFNKLDSRRYTTYGSPYDYDSIMHYEKRAFSKNGRDTIVSKPPGKTFGVAEAMSHWDIHKINKMYNC